MASHPAKPAKITPALRRDFVRDYALPIQIVDEPHFTYMLELLDPIYQTKDKYSLFVDTVQRLGGEGNFHIATKAVIEQAVNAITSQPSFATIDQAAVDALFAGMPEGPHVPGADIYTMQYAQQTMVSIDLRSANFLALRHFNPALVGNMATYKEFMERFTREAYFLQSKQIRQVVFGKANPRMQQVIEKRLTGAIMAALVAPGGPTAPIPADHLCTASADEVVIRTSAGCPLERVAARVGQIFEAGASPVAFLRPSVRAVAFALEPIGGRKFFLRRSTMDVVNGADQVGRTEYKNIPAYHLPQAIKAATGRPVQLEDLAFLFEGQVAYFGQPLFPQAAPLALCLVPTAPGPAQ
ncbi:putative R3H domain protein [Paratrimastix pyriformis]|uniref:R3H domain protein n=1 Tax=Paratrimastix pyriformis TaxID=342808 RepID=A0ABQ8UMC2_9EUKA|nr:putative R3H domain protein [Paratrimastix pyriformis]